MLEYKRMNGELSVELSNEVTGEEVLAIGLHLVGQLCQTGFLPADAVNSLEVETLEELEAGCQFMVEELSSHPELAPAHYQFIASKCAGEVYAVEVKNLSPGPNTRVLASEIVKDFSLMLAVVMTSLRKATPDDAQFLALLQWLIASGIEASQRDETQSITHPGVH